MKYSPIENQAPQPDYPLRLSSFAISLILHCVVATAIMFIAVPASRLEGPVQDELIKPSERTILFYDFRRKVPEVRPVTKVGHVRDPRGKELSRQTIVATSRHPRSSQVFISVPAPKIHIEQDPPAPVLVARLDAIAPLPPPPERPKPRMFVPPRSSQEPKLSVQRPILDMQPPALPSSMVFSPAQTVQLPVISASPKSAPETPIPHPGNDRADIAVAALHPTENPDTPIPVGDRPGQFSKAPERGEAASGDDNNRAALTVPDLTIRNAKPEAIPPIATEEILYTQRVRSVSAATLSVPLRPGSRMIPAGVDAHFKGRNVYTIVIPMEHMSAYAGDWILWFAERDSKAGETPVMRAPVPFRKVEPVDQAPPNERTSERIQFSATLGKNGRLNGIALLTKASAGVQHAVLEDVTSWEFQPATSDGAAVEVDVVLEIPFNLPIAIAKGGL